MMIEDLFVYTWDNVLRDYETGRISVVASHIHDARRAAIDELTDSDDIHTISVSEPSEIVPFTVPFVFFAPGSA